MKECKENGGEWKTVELMGIFEICVFTYADGGESCES